MTVPAEDAADQEFPDESAPAATTIQPASKPSVTLHVDDIDATGWREDFTGLLVLGSLHAWFDWCGHRIVIRTLSTDEELLAARLISDVEGSMGGMKAYATATAGLCVESIDGHPMPVPLGEDPDKPWAWAQQRFGYARRWYPPTIDAIFDGYLQLETRQREVLANLGKAWDLGAAATPG